MSVLDRSPAIKILVQKLRQYGRYSIGRVTGTTTNKDGKYKYFISNEERGLIMRAEMNALIALLVHKGIVAQGDFEKELEQELELALKDQAVVFPEVIVLEDGKGLTVDTAAFAKRVKEESWPP